jgi:hypothetical protein
MVSGSLPQVVAEAVAQVAAAMLPKADPRQQPQAPDERVEAEDRP